MSEKIKMTVERARSFVLLGMPEPGWSGLRVSERVDDKTARRRSAACAGCDTIKLVRMPTIEGPKRATILAKCQGGVRGRPCGCVVAESARGGAEHITPAGIRVEITAAGKGLESSKRCPRGKWGAIQGDHVSDDVSFPS